MGNSRNGDAVDAVGGSGGGGAVDILNTSFDTNLQLPAQVHETDSKKGKK